MFEDEKFESREHEGSREDERRSGDFEAAEASVVKGLICRRLAKQGSVLLQAARASAEGLSVTQG